MDDIVVASTTDTQEELDHAVSPNWREPFRKAESTEKPKESSEAPAKDAKTSTESETAHPKEQEGKSKTETHDPEITPEIQAIIDKRIGKEIARRKAAEEALERQRGETHREAPKEEPVAAKADGPNLWDDPTDPEPPLSDYPTRDETKAYNAWSRRQIIRETAFQNEERKRQENSAKLEEDAIKAYPDWKTVTDVDRNILKPEVQQFIASFKNSRDVIYHLAKQLGNTDAQAAFKELSAADQTEHVVLLSASLLPSQSNQQAPPKPKPTSQAPAPTTPEKGASRAGAPRFEPDDTSPDATDDWIKRKNAEDRERRRRN